MNFNPPLGKEGARRIERHKTKDKKSEYRS